MKPFARIDGKCCQCGSVVNANCYERNRTHEENDDDTWVRGVRAGGGDEIG